MSLYPDIEQSLKKAITSDFWMGRYANQYGIPFVWKRPASDIFFEMNTWDVIANWLAWYSPLYPVAGENEDPEFRRVLAELENLFEKYVDHLFPFQPLRSRMDEYIKGNALSRAQDFNFIHFHCEGLPSSNLRHCDVGPGLGGGAAYSLAGFGGQYIGVDAVPMSYGIQRFFFRFLSTEYGKYFDFINAETCSLSERELAANLRSPDYKIKHLPSWKFHLLEPGSLDLMSATFMMNELSHSGAVWVIFNTLRALKIGGYIYFRDSNVLYPNHDVDYDQLVQSLGCRLVAKSSLKNMVEFHGVQRCYRKEKPFEHEDFYSFCAMILKNKVISAEVHLIDED